jgi:hypothetical protein
LRILQPAQARIAKASGGIKIPDAPSGKSDFANMDALAAARDLYGQKILHLKPSG